MPSAPPNSPASNTTLSRGDATPGWYFFCGGPVVLGEHERGEIDLVGELDEPVERGPPRVERGHPGLDVGHVFETARHGLQQLGLFARRPEEDARLVHARSGPSLASVLRRRNLLAQAPTRGTWLIATTTLAALKVIRGVGIAAVVGAGFGAANFSSSTTCRLPYGELGGRLVRAGWTGVADAAEVGSLLLDVRLGMGRRGGGCRVARAVRDRPRCGGRGRVTDGCDGRLLRHGFPSPRRVRWPGTLGEARYWMAREPACLDRFSAPWARASSAPE